MKTLIPSLIIVTFSTIFTTSCSRDAKEETAKTKGKATEQLKQEVPAFLLQEVIDPNDVFALTRSGQMVTIKWRDDLSTYKGAHIQVLRNTIGGEKNYEIVARLEGKIKSHEDIVPSAGAFWYWFRITPPNGTTRGIGPMRVAPDEENTGKYVKYEDIYKLYVDRNATSARISWNVPGKNLKQLLIRRNTRMHLSGRKTITVASEWVSRIDDAFPDPNADYWYWMEVMLENGTSINIGPLKAEYREE